MLLSNALREYIKDYELGRSEHSFEEIMDVLELYYINKSLPKYEYEKFVYRLSESNKERLLKLEENKENN